MTSAQRVIVGYDGSADADRGLDWAIDFARPRKLPLEVFASSADLTFLRDRSAEQADGVASAWLDQASGRLKESGLDWSTALTRGKVVPELIAASSDAAIVVVGARGHGVLGGMLLGSVSQHLARHAHCPVAVVRPPRSTTSDRILVGVDGSDPSLAALRFAFDHAELTHGTVVALNGRSIAAVNGPWDVDVAPAVAGEMESARQLLADAVDGLRAEHPDVSVELQAVPVPEIRALADASVNASLVVVGTRGYGGFTGLLLGSVSAGVLHQAQCPVVVVR
jgi:nucleotide-binding universal stress UspA family protein